MKSKGKCDEKTRSDDACRGGISHREALTEAGRRLASSMPRRSCPPCPALPTALLGRPIAVSLDTKSSCTGLGMRGKIVSK